jgi:hypothetical protein
MGDRDRAVLDKFVETFKEVLRSTDKVSAEAHSSKIAEETNEQIPAAVPKRSGGSKKSPAAKKAKKAAKRQSPMKIKSSVDRKAVVKNKTAEKVAKKVAKKSGR